MELLQPIEIKRSKVAHQNPIYYDSRLATNEFFPPGQTYFGRQIIPPSNKWSDGSASFMAPISHYHLLQCEVFHVERGEGYWYMRGQRIHLKAGQDITIPRCVGHRFENIPGGKEALSILYRYDEQMYKMERRFFANTLTYMDDCRTQGKSISLCQLCLFCTMCWMPPEVLWVPGGEYVRCAVNTLFMWTLAIIGIVIYGYRSSYVEYYDPELVEQETKKEQ